MGIYVLGMHRSGTSALSRALGLMTGYQGFVEAGRGNLAGHWENPVVRRELDTVLDAADAHWAAPPPAESGLLAAAPTRSRRRLRSELARLGTGPWVLKDPRLCLALCVVREFDAQPASLVHIFRDPAEVARSLEVRDGLPISLGLALWSSYVRGQIAAARRHGTPSLWVSQNSLMQRPARQIERIGDWLWSEGWLSGPADYTLAIESIRPELRTVGPSTPSKSVSQEIRELHATLLEMSQQPGPVYPSFTVPQLDRASMDAIESHRTVALQRRRVRALRRNLYWLEPLFSVRDQLSGRRNTRVV